MGFGCDGIGKFAGGVAIFDIGGQQRAIYEEISGYLSAQSANFAQAGQDEADAMRAILAEDLGVSVAQISVKATTSERLGFTGREEGIAALATAALVRA